LFPAVAAGLFRNDFIHKLQELATAAAIVMR
jgi:hypothetical protein